MKRVWMIVLFILTILLLTACGGTDADTSKENGGDTGETDSAGNGLLAELKESGTVVVGFANEKPYAYEENGELKGAAVDIAKAVFKELGVDEVDPHLAEFGDLIAGLDAGRFDVVTAGMAITPDRCENVIFGEPEMKYG